MLRQAREKAISRTKANRFIRRCWIIKSGLKYWPPRQNKHIWARVVGVLPNNMIRIEFDLNINGEQVTYQKEIYRYSLKIQPLSSEVAHLLEKGWEGLFFFPQP